MEPNSRGVSRYVRVLRFFARGLALGVLAGGASVLFLGVRRVLAGPAELPSAAACLIATALVAGLLGLLVAPPVRAAWRRLTSRLRDRFEEEPELRASLRAVEAASLSGSFDVVPLAILVQTLHASWRTGVLAADFGGRQGRIYFERGEVVEARFGPASGTAAFNLMYAESGGAFVFRPHARKVRRSVESRVLRLLVDAERSRGEGDTSVQWAVRPFPQKRPHRRTPEHDRERAN